MSALKKKSISSKSTRPRTGWFVIIIKLGDMLEINLGWRFYDGSIHFYSASSPFSTSKIPWGELRSFAYIRKKNDMNEEGDYVEFENETGDKTDFKGGGKFECTMRD